MIEPLVTERACWNAKAQGFAEYGPWASLFPSSGRASQGDTATLPTTRTRAHGALLLISYEQIGWIVAVSSRLTGVHPKWLQVQLTCTTLSFRCACTSTGCCCTTNLTLRGLIELLIELNHLEFETCPLSKIFRLIMDIKISPASGTTHMQAFVDNENNGNRRGENVVGLFVIDRVIEQHWHQVPCQCIAMTLHGQVSPFWVHFGSLFPFLGQVLWTSLPLKSDNGCLKALATAN
jgi:hypothetical protein